MGIKLKESIGETEEGLVDSCNLKDSNLGGDHCLALYLGMPPLSWLMAAEAEWSQHIQGFPGIAWLSLHRTNIRISAAPQFYLDGLQCCE